jgi:hypothetical protein
MFAKTVNSYLTELNPEVMKVMAGFGKDEEYYIPRSELGLPDWISQDDLIRCLFPSYERWRAEHCSVVGDDSKAASNFLLDIIPFFANVIFQDGIYWLKKYPNSEVSVHLRNVLPPQYQRWGHHAREEVEMNEAAFVSCRIAEFNLATQQAFLTMTNEVKDLKQQLLHMNRVISNLSNSHAQQPPEVPQLLEVPDLPETPQESASPPWHRRSINEVLRNTPREPSFPPSLPDTMADILTQHELYGLDQFRNATKTNWSNALRVAYSKRLYLYEQIAATARRLRQAGTFEEKLKVAADTLDIARNNMSMAKYLNRLKYSDPQSKKRKRNK